MLRNFAGFNRLIAKLLLGSLSIVIAFCVGPHFSNAQGREEKLQGYAEWHKGELLIVEGQRVRADAKTKFKKLNKQVITSLRAIPLGCEVIVKGVRQSDGIIRAKEVEAKPNAMAWFEDNAWNGSKQLEDFWLAKGRMLIGNSATGSWQDRGRIISSGLQFKRISRIMRRLRPAYLKPDALRVRVVENKEWNASAMANGAIWVHSSLLKDMSDDELAVILGHELAHFTHEHTRRGMKKDMWTNLGAGLLQALSTNAPVKNQADLQQLTLLFMSAWRNGYSRDLEDQADRVGLRYAYEGGFNVVKGIQVWERMRQRYGETDKMTNFFQGTHSRPTERLENLRRELLINYQVGKTSTSRNSLRQKGRQRAKVHAVAKQARRRATVHTVGRQAK